MGLASSQARLLTLTTHQNHVEGRLSDISDMLTDLSRKSADASKKYTNSLGATELVYSDGQNSYDVSYDLLMNPNSVVNTQYVLTSATGAVIMDDDYLNKCKVGSNLNSGSAADLASNENKFAAIMMGESESDIEDAIETAGMTGFNNNDNGSESATPVIKLSYNDNDIFRDLADMPSSLSVLSSCGFDASSYRNSDSQIATIYGSGGNKKAFNDDDIQGIVEGMKVLVDAVSCDVATVIKSMYSSPEIEAALEEAAKKTRDYYNAHCSDEEVLQSIVRILKLKMLLKITMVCVLAQMAVRQHG